jgi:hypothetical protein
MLGHSHHSGANMVKQLLIKWDALPEDMATWEDEGEL